MDIQKIASYISLIEGKKSQARIGEVREMLAILCDMIQSDPEVVPALVKNGARRSKKKKK